MPKKRMNGKKVWTVTMLICATGLLYLLYSVKTFQSLSPKLIGNKSMPPLPELQPPMHSHVTESAKCQLPASSNWSQVDFKLNVPILKDWKTVAFSPKSTITLENRGPYNVGDVVKVNITVKDFQERKKERGGDMVRIWIKDSVNHACAAGHVEDNHDGSYQGSVTLLWAGNITISARIATPREMADFLCASVHTGRTNNLMKGLFKRGLKSEIKKCSPIPDRYPRFCNLTIRNSDLPWYCEMPVKASCDDWLSTIFYFSHQNYTIQETEMFKRIHHYQYMDSNIHLTVRNDNRTPTLHTSRHNEDLIACNEVPTRLTWDAPSPRGYLYRWVWYSTQCRSTFDGSVDAFTTCLKGRKLWLIGDSTIRQFFSYLGKFLKLHLTTETWTRHSWHKPSSESNDNRTITVFWGLHALPFHHSTAFDNNLEVKGTHLYIDSIPAKSKDIVVIHFYMHFMGNPPYVFRNHVQKAKDSILALKTRAPDVKVIVKGSHAFHDERKGIGMFYDFWGPVYDRIMREEFATILDDVIFLDLWELTLSTENRNKHPNNTVVKTMINYMMSFICQ